MIEMGNRVRFAPVPAHPWKTRASPGGLDKGGMAILRDEDHSKTTVLPKSIAILHIKTALDHLVKLLWHRIRSS